MIKIEKEHLNEVVTILGTFVPGCEVRAFGSRVTGSSFPYSDLDLVIVGEKKLEWKCIEDLKNAFSDSNLPIMVDVLDWHSISGNFQKLIEQNYEVVRQR
ncbi:MAG: nucleotidyltransferase family protein [Nitrospinota bacterium]